MNLRFSGEESSIAFGMDSILHVNVGHVFNNFLQIRGIFAYSAFLSDTEADAKAAKFMESICGNIQHLRKLCSDNGNTILKRWKKKTREKREALLREVEPGTSYPALHFKKSWNTF